MYIAARHASKPLLAGLPGNLQADDCRHITPRGSLAITRLAVLLLVALALLGSGCARRKAKAPVPVSTRPPLPSVLGATETGVASWYGHPYHGRQTANGETYDQEAMTAAHPSLAFNTWVQVENLDNGLETRVRINDRGPFVKHRAIDLSRAAARALAMLGPGTANVRVVVVALPDPSIATGRRPSPFPPLQPAAAITSENAAPGTNGQPTSIAHTPPGTAPAQSPSGGQRPAHPKPASQGLAPLWEVQFGAFQSLENAQRLRDQVALRLPDARVVASPSTAGLWLVLAGQSPSRESAEEIVRTFRDDFPRIFPVPAH